MKLAIVAGEASGDLHASEVVRELKQLDPTLQTFGIGGDLLAREGMRILHHAREMGMVGLFNVIRHLGMFRRILNEMTDTIAREKPDAVMLVDYPDFNLRLAKRCKAMGLRVIYYISPQVWAWRRGRVKQIGRLVDRMLVIFPFEEDFYRQHNVPVTYVGHPLIDEMAPLTRRFAPPSPEGEGTRNREPSPSGEGGRRPDEGMRIALLPGSRRHEVRTLLPPMLDALSILKKEREVDAFIIQAPTISSAELLAVMQKAHDFVRIVPHDRGEALSRADVALSSSGTATLECAIAGVPVIVMYRLSSPTHWLAQRLVKLRHFSLVNIVAGKDVVPELLQEDVNGERIAREVRKLLDPAENARVRGELAVVTQKLGRPGASRRAAEAIMSSVRA
ncbi:MAG TPA: lipid-A-disaccharide synthase [Thermoanaerobaculia bacterium]|nr:lipid-A-disaccharide synthase [Thermoanaerobaculia bacterium]